MENPKAVVTSHTVTIEAPASVVWQVLIDLPSYSEWNPFTVKVESDLRLGEKVDLYLPKPKQADELMMQREYLKLIEPEQQLSWGMAMGHRWLLEARRDQYIEVIDSRSCRYHTTDSFTGLLTGLVMKSQGQWIKDGFDAIATALKKRAETLV